MIRWSRLLALVALCPRLGWAQDTTAAARVRRRTRPRLTPPS